MRQHLLAAVAAVALLCPLEAWAANVTMVAPDGVTPFGTAANPVASTSPTQGGVWWIEANNAAAAAGANVTGVARSSSSSQGSGGPYGYFQVSVYSSQAGTISLYNNSLAGGSQVASQAVAAGATVVIKVPSMGASYTSQFTNGSTAGNVSLSDGYTLN